MPGKHLDVVGEVVVLVVGDLVEEHGADGGVTTGDALLQHLGILVFRVDGHLQLLKVHLGNKKMKRLPNEVYAYTVSQRNLNN